MGHTRRPVVKHTMKVRVTGVWIDVDLVDPKLGMTMRPESPLYDKDEWIRGRDADHIATVNAYTSGDYDQVQAAAKKETGLDILEHDTDYDCFSFFVDVSDNPTWATIVAAGEKLRAFVERHFHAIQPE